MRRIESFEDDRRGVVTYELNDGRRVCVAASAVSELGIAAVLRHMGLGDQIPTGRVPVLHHGEMVGTLPADFDPRFLKSKSWLYDPRPGDWHRDGNRWIANRTLGMGDIEAIDGFQPS